MSELLKDVYTKEYLAEVSSEIKKYYKSFNTSKFLENILSGDWEYLELKMRIKRISESLYLNLPDDYPEAVNILMKAAIPFSSYQAMFFPNFIETYGLDKKNIKKSLEALEELTKYSSSEFAIRPFIELDPERIMKKMLSWSKSKNFHVRRLSSEGCRSRLPWAMALTRFKKDPSLIFPILENLKNDSELYVRKSVANNLNDISKDHPGIALEIAQRWYGSTSHTNWIVKHGLRTLLKQGDSRALKVFGYSNIRNISFEKFKVERNVSINSYLIFDFSLVVKKKSKLRLEYKIYYLKSNGVHNSKVFKITEGDYDKGHYQFSKKQSFKEMSTRRHYKGEHFLSIVVNGVEFEKRRFMLI